MEKINIEQLIKTLNIHQNGYVNFDLPNPKNGEYLLAVFHLVSGGKLNILQAAAEVAQNPPQVQILM